MESRRAFILVTGQTCITGIPQDQIIQMMEKLKPFANVIFVPCCYLLFIPSRFTALKNSFKGSEIEANNQSILFYQFNWKAMESIKKKSHGSSRLQVFLKDFTRAVEGFVSQPSPVSTLRVAEIICQAAHMFLVPWEEENIFVEKKWKF